MVRQWGEEELGLFNTHKHLAYEVLKHFPSQERGYVDDILSYAHIGLWHAIESYDASKDMAFRNWALMKMKYAAQDGLRELDYITRGSRDSIKHLAAATNELSQKLGTYPTFKQLREHGVDTDQAVYAARFANQNEPETGYWLDAITVRGPEDEVMDLETEREMSRLIAQLPTQMSIVVELIYYGQYNQAEVGEIMGLTYSRIFQIHKAAMARLKDMLS